MIQAELSSGEKLAKPNILPESRQGKEQSTLLFGLQFRLCCEMEEKTPDEEKVAEEKKVYP